MELKKPHRKRRCNVDSQQPFPIFIESEIGISIENWVPIICTGIFNGYGVVVKAPAEISALHNMGTFGKGSSSRSRPLIMRNNGKMPRFLRKRQYTQRMKWVSERDSGLSKNKNTIKDLLSTDIQDDINKLNSVFDNISVKKRNGQYKDNQRKKICSKSEIIDVLSSDEEVKIQQELDKSGEPTALPDCESTISDTHDDGNNKECKKHSENENDPIDGMDFPTNSIIVMPDSDPGNDDYFKDLKPMLYIDKSEWQENLILTLQEAYFLAFGLGCLQILDESGKALDLDSIWKLFCSVQKDFSSKYIVYHYFRSKGWVVKPGIKFGGDFLLYKEGPPYYHAGYIVLIEVIEEACNSSEQNKYDWSSILCSMRMAGTAKKEVLIVKVIIPDGFSLEKLNDNPEYISKFMVEEILLRRWEPKHERNNTEDS